MNLPAQTRQTIVDDTLELTDGQQLQLTRQIKMNSLRIARAALRARPAAAFRVPLQRRGYADASDKVGLLRTTRTTCRGY